MAAATVLVFTRSLGHEFLRWDDHDLFVVNPGYRGLGWTQLKWMATTAQLGHYVPVTWVSFGLDYLVWGMRPLGYHLTNVVLHAVNAALVFVLAERVLARAMPLSGSARRVGAASAALLFALHPLRVEAVSWVTGRRDVLAAFWALLALLGYLRAAEEAGGRRRWLGWSLAAYALAILSKATVMTLPVVLVTLDVYPLGRLPGDPRRWTARETRGVWIEKVPYLALAAAAAAISYVGQSRGSGVKILAWPTWLATTFFTLWFHVRKTLLPLALSPLYELPAQIEPWAPRFVVAGIAVTAITVGLVLARRVWPAGLVAWILYVALLAPVCAPAHAGPQLTADRYSYLPGLGLAVVAGAGAAWLWGRRSLLAVVALVVLLAGLVPLTWRQQGAWRDTGRLWTQSIEAVPDCAQCRGRLANWLDDHDRPAEALEQYERALALDPGLTRVRTNVGLVLVRLGRPAEAIPQYEQVLARYPDAVGVRVSLATALLVLGRREEAAERLGAATRPTPSTGLVEFFQARVAANPAAPIARLGLYQTYLALGDDARAQEQHEALSRLDPELARVAAAAVRARP